MEAFWRQPGLHSNRARRWRDQPGRSPGSELDRPERIYRGEQPDDPGPSDPAGEDDNRAPGRRELRARRFAQEGLPGHCPAVPDPRLIADHWLTVPIDGLPARRDGVA